MDIKNLNPEQKKAVTHDQGPLLIVAGAGTGKTTVITQRIAWLISEKKAKSDEILALTFTEKAAGEMEERVDKLLPYGYVDLWISTFHAFGERVLRDYGLEIGLPNNFKLLNQTEQWMLVRQNLGKFNLDYYRPLGNPTKFIHALLKHFSRAKDELVAPAEYLEYVKGLKLDSDSAMSLGVGAKAKGKLAKGDRELLAAEINRYQEVANAYHVYQQLLLDSNALDFGDLINYTLRLFKERPVILEKFRKKFKYILVDEFQDTNWAQYELLKLLAKPENNITVVGDDDQCLPGDSFIMMENGKRRIKNIKVGDKVVTGVGKGHMGLGKVARVFKNKKESNILEITTKSGKKVAATDNHKMFYWNLWSQRSEKALKVTRHALVRLGFKTKLNKADKIFEATVDSAKKLLVGDYLPVNNGAHIIYDQIIDIKEKKSRQVVYDLEIGGTHNYLAGGIAVHNSIYKFRGASVSNILQFKDDFPKSEEVFLVNNYRSTQDILDKSYEFIQLNNPNRLEVKLKKGALTKKLKSCQKGVGVIEHLHYKTFEDEAYGVVGKIMELKENPSTSFGAGPSARLLQDRVLQDEVGASQALTWNDFAILVRANDTAEMFVQALANAGIPYQFMASRGLYAKPVILDILSYLKLLDDYHESTAVYRILSLPYWKIPPSDLAAMNNLARKKSWSLYEALQKSAKMLELQPRTLTVIDNFLKLLEKHSLQTKDQSVGKLVLSFLEDFNYLKYMKQDLDEQKSREAFSYLNQFYKEINQFEQESADKSLAAFMRSLEHILESGDEGALTPDWEEGPESVKVMTVHGAKGLEFQYVFIAGLVDKRFPTIERKEPIELPAKLVKEIIPEGDIHLQEERRLFYVAMTRAKEGVFLTSAEDYGGMRKKKLSRFLAELGMAECEKPTKEQADFGERMRALQKGSPSTSYKYAVPNWLSYTQLKAFETCPYQYRFAHILKVPVRGKPQFSFGKTMHKTLEQFFRLVQERSRMEQGDLFGGSPSARLRQVLDTRSDQRTQPRSGQAGGIQQKRSAVSLDELLALYNQAWIDDWYEDKKQMAEYKEKGKKVLKEFYESIKDNVPVPKYLEKSFKLKVGDYSVFGVIDRVDDLGGNKVELIDYKTGKPKDEKNFKKEDKEQLFIYQLAVNQVFSEEPVQLTFHYLEDNKKVSFLGTEKELKEMEEKIIKIVEAIHESTFPATPSPFKCKYCDFKGICEYRIL